MQVLGFDPASGPDETVLTLRGSHSTAVEVEMRLQDYNRRMGNVHDRMRQFSDVVLQMIMDTKVPLIRYGRRKRRHRRMIPRMPRVQILTN